MKTRAQHNYLIFILILTIALLLRGYDLFEIPFTHDEFSAYFRTQFNSFSELIAQGARIDGHPVGVQVFLYYWIQLFGAKAWVVKLPFILCGIGAVWLIYKLGKLWCNNTVGLIAAAFMAISQFPVMYSQIARPYVSGLFFTLLMCWFWSKLIKNPNQRFWRNGIGFVLGAALCTYNHHFSMLFAVIVGVSGFFLIARKFWIKYLLLGIAVFVLYIPHLEILFHQMSMKGVEGWLSKPESDFIIDFVRYIFNYSWWLLLVVLAIIVIGFYNREKGISKKHYILFAVFFFLPFLIGFFYSVYVNALLQFSVLIFSYPFLYFLLFGHIKSLKPSQNLIIVTVILLVGLLSLIFERKHYDIFYNDHFDQVLVDFQEAKSISNSELPAIIDTRKDIVHFYAEKHGLDTNFYWYDDFESINELHQFVKNQAYKKDYFYLGANSRFNPALLPLIQHYFPKIVWQRNYFIGTHILFSKAENIDKTEKITLISEVDFNTNNHPNWGAFEEKTLTTKGLYVDQSMEWTPAFEDAINNCIEHRNDFIDVVVTYHANQPIHEAVLVISVDKEEESIHWLGVPFNDHSIDDYKGDQLAFSSLKLSDIRGFEGANIKVYVWNKEHEDFTISEIKIYKRTGNPIIYGLFEPI